MNIYGHAIPQVEPSATGIHLIWMGPYPWVYSPGGWSIQRRKYRQKHYETICDRLEVAEFARSTLLRMNRERRLRFGTVTLRDGFWPVSITPSTAPPGSQPVPCDVFTLELDVPQSSVQVEIVARDSFAFALREGKVVDTGGARPTSGAALYDLNAVDIDTVMVYAPDPSFLGFCIRADTGPDEWEDGSYVVKQLQLPLKELNPALAGSNDEYAEGKARLLAGESLDRTEFEHLADILRVGVKQVGPPRPIDQVLLLRESTSADFEELTALDPIRVLLSHPRWRRILGFGWFDQDPSLVAGETYEYRITGYFPADDLTDTVYGFHTIPSQTALPVEFYLHDLRMRVPQPVTVERTPGAPAGLIGISRRGIGLHPGDQDFWNLPSLEDWSLVIDFPSPVNSVMLELQDGHDLKYAWGKPWGPLNGPDPVPPGLRPLLNFPTPILQLRLRGKGFLYAIRVPSGSRKLTAVSMVLPPVTLVDAPRPEPPVTASVSNLQQPQPAPADDTPPAALPPRHALGFQVEWQPALRGGLTIWPADQDAPPPLDASLYQVEHREEPATTWEPVLPDRNWMMGDRDKTAHNTHVYPGVDLMTLFPEVPRHVPGAGMEVHWRDVFDFKEGGGPAPRPVPPPGTSHQYRVRTIDPIGRPSLSWRTTNILRLEKHVPPPLPVGPDETSADELTLPAPTGVQARVLVRDAPDLTAADLAALGADSNVIVLRWGWHQQQRDQDPFAREFRIYVADKPLDSVSGTLTNVATVSPGVYNATLNLSRAVTADAAKGSSLQAGYPFYIRTHTAGSNVTATLETRVQGADGSLPAPRVGPITLPLHLTPDLTRPPAWSQRIEVQPITAASQYEAIVRNCMTLAPAHPRDAVWVGISAADDQTYVPDQLAPVGTRPGNESAIVPVLCEARYHGRPVFNIPPALASAPALRAPEPNGRPIFFSLDLAPYLSGAELSSGDLILPERASADAVFAAYYVSSDNRIMARAIDPRDSSEADSEVVLANPGDRAAVIAELNDARTTALEDRYVVFLAGSHPYRDRLFEPAAQSPVPFGPFQETLPSQSGRYIYFVRKSDAAGHLSAGGAVARVVVHVPSLAPGAAPEKLQRESGDGPGVLRLRIAPEPQLTHVLAFSRVLAGGNGQAGEADLLRVPNAHDLYPNNGIRLRVPDGTLLPPQVKALSDPDVTTDADGFRVVVLNFSEGAGARIRVWTCSLTRDGVPSLLGGPWSLAMPVAPLGIPALSVSGTPPNLNFTWSWPPGQTYSVALEGSTDGTTWMRVSALLPETAHSYAYAQPAGSRQYRLAVMSPDGRIVYSNIVTK